MEHHLQCVHLIVWKEPTYDATIWKGCFAVLHVAFPRDPEDKELTSCSLCPQSSTWNKSALLVHASLWDLSPSSGGSKLQYPYEHLTTRFTWTTRGWPSHPQKGTQEGVVQLSSWGGTGNDLSIIPFEACMAAFSLCSKTTKFKTGALDRQPAQSKHEDPAVNTTTKCEWKMPFPFKCNCLQASKNI